MVTHMILFLAEALAFLFPAFLPSWKLRALVLACYFVIHKLVQQRYRVWKHDLVVRT